MNISTYEPWNVVSRFNDEISRLFQTPYPDKRAYAVVTDAQRWAPAVDIREEPERFLLIADLPGIDPENIEITAEDGVLSIKGERRDEPKAESTGYRQTERRYGMFHRRFALPETADLQRITATGKHGVLEVAIPKKEKARARKIEVKA